MQPNFSSSLRKVVVTGANKGIGYSIVDGLLGGETPYHVILTARNPSNAETALHKLQHKHKNTTSKLQTKELNITDPTSIQHFADWVKQDLGTIDVLVNNAAIGFWPEDNKTQKLDTINTNFFGTIAVTEKLLPYLSVDGKIINISSGSGRLSGQGHDVVKVLEDHNLTNEKLLQLAGKLYEHCEHGTPNDLKFSSSAYYATKALLNAYTRWILPKMLKEDQQCFSVSPGWCQTDMGGQDAPLTAEDGADTPIYLINLPFKKDPKLNGQFIEKRKVTHF